jgi:hypothetical protein
MLGGSDSILLDVNRKTTPDFCHSPNLNHDIVLGFAYMF